MELSLTLAGESVVPLLAGSTINRSRDSRVSTASLNFIGYPDPLLGTAVLGDHLGLNPAPLDAVVVTDASSNNVFSGQVISASRDPGQFGPKAFMVTAQCADDAWKLAHPPALITKLYDAQSDRAIIQDAISTGGLSGVIGTNDADIDIIDSSLSLAFDRATPLEVIEAVAAETGGVWFVDVDGDLHYNTEANATAAPFNVDTDAPNDSTTFDVENLTLEEHFEDPANEVVILGGLDSFGARFIGTATDATSKTTYGTFFKVIEQSGLISQALVDDFAAIILENGKDPVKAGGFETTEDGLDVNQKIDVTCARYGLSAETLLISELSMLQETATRTRYRVGLSDDDPSPDAFLRRVSGGRAIAGPQELRGMEFDKSGTPDDLEVDMATSDMIDQFPMFCGAWIYLNTLTADATIVRFSAGDNGALSTGWIFRVNSSGQLDMRVFGSTGNWLATASSPAIVAGRWYHVMGRMRDDQLPRLWINGSEVSYQFQSNGSGTLSTGDTLHIGYNKLDVDAGGAARPFDGVIAKVFVWREAVVADSIVNTLSASPSMETFKRVNDSNNIEVWSGLDDLDDGNAPSAVPFSVRIHAPSARFPIIWSSARSPKGKTRLWIKE